MRRHPQDPQGPRARWFARWLRRDPRHRRVLLQNRLARDEDDTEGWGAFVVWGIAGGFVLWGIGRLITGRFIPW
jgi:hypothetical protein